LTERDGYKSLTLKDAAVELFRKHSALQPTDPSEYLEDLVNFSLRRPIHFERYVEDKFREETP